MFPVFSGYYILNCCSFDSMLICKLLLGNASGCVTSSDRNYLLLVENGTSIQGADPRALLLALPLLPKVTVVTKGPTLGEFGHSLGVVEC